MKICKNIEKETFGIDMEILFRQMGRAHVYDSALIN